MAGFDARAGLLTSDQVIRGMLVLAGASALSAACWDYEHGLIDLEGLERRVDAALRDEDDNRRAVR